MPGIKKSEIELSIKENSYLCLETSGDEKLKYRWALNDRIDPGKIKAEYKDGLLTISLQTRKELVKKIDIA